MHFKLYTKIAPTLAYLKFGFAKVDRKIAGDGRNSSEDKGQPRRDEAPVMVGIDGNAIVTPSNWPDCNNSTENAVEGLSELLLQWICWKIIR